MENWLRLELDSNYSRPVIMLDGVINCLIDTGSDTPVWTWGRELLVSKLKAKKEEGKHFLLSGFGKNPEVTDVYTIPELELKAEDGSDRVVFKNLVVACTSRTDMIAKLILPATAFSHMNYMIRNEGVDIPRLEIEHKKEEYFVRPRYGKKDERFLENVYSFAREVERV